MNPLSIPERHKNMPVTRRVLLCCICLVTVSTVRLSGQLDTTENTFTNQQAWLDVTPQYRFSEKFRIYGDLGYRTVIRDRYFNRAYFRPSAGYRIHSLVELTGGLGLFNDFNKNDFNRYELRPWQGIALTWPKTRHFQLKNYGRLEERFSYLESRQSFSYGTRFRHQLSFRLDILKKEKGSFWFVNGYGELFAPLDDNISELFRNSGRLGFGIGHNFASSWRINLLYNLQRTRTERGNSLEISDYIFRVRISKTFYKKQEGQE